MIINRLIFLAIVFSLISCTNRMENNKGIPVGKLVINPNFDFKPNIVWIVAEDLSSYLPSFGDSTIVTPNLDKLASSGICYDNFYSPHPVCAPARASIITGMYANSIGASHMRTGPWYAGQATKERIEKNNKYLPEGIYTYEAVPSPKIKMFTEYLRSAGYYCTNNKKEDYQFVKTPTAWDDNSNKAHWRNRPTGTPFFSVFNLEVTHESRIWSKKNDSLWVKEDLNVPIPPYLPNTEIVKKDIRRMYSNILEMDAQVGEILQQIEDDGLMDNTIIIWYTDHGGPLPRQKRLLYESGIKVPMIIRFPNEQFKGQRDDRMISFVDLAPTMLSIAKINVPDYMNGTAFLGNSIRSNEVKYIFGAADRFDEFTDRIRSVKGKQFKYIKNFIPEKSLYSDLAYRKQMPIMQELLRLQKEGQLTKYQALWFRDKKPSEELYDLYNDPHELNNLAENPEYKVKLQELRQVCEEWIDNINDTGMMDEKELIEKFWPHGVQPQTADPEIIIDNTKISIHCKTEGASIGYKIVMLDDDPAEKNWLVYSEPIELANNSKIVAIAHRIGYKRSKEVIINTK